MTDTIKSVTKCPTCGSEVTVGGEGETHFYIPKSAVSTFSWTELIALKEYYDKKIGGAPNGGCRSQEYLDAIEIAKGIEEKLTEIGNSIKNKKS